MNIVDATLPPFADAAKVNANFSEVQSAIDALGSGSSSASIPGFFNVKDFGALGNGVADDTVAIQAGYNAAAAVKGTLFFPSGNYICSGLDIGGVMDRGCTFLGMAFDAKGYGNITSVITLKSGANRHLFRCLPGDAPQQRFFQLLFDGNDANQTVPSYIIYCDADLTPNTYPVGIQVEYCHFVRGSGGGIYLGAHRGNNYIANTNFYSCGLLNAGHGIYIDTFDVTMMNCHIGNSYGYGIYVNQTSQFECHSVHSYVNQMGGIFIGAGVTDMSFISGSIDRNIRYGINSTKNTNTTYSGGRSFIGTRFHANSSGFDGGFPDVYISSGDTDFMFTGCSWLGAEDLTHKPAVAIQFQDATGSAKIGPNRFAPGTRWKYGAIISLAQIITDNRIS